MGPGRSRAGGTPAFVASNAPFDWSFENYYFHRFIGSNPFGLQPSTSRPYYMGVMGCDLGDTRSSRMAKSHLTGDHMALHDALYQAELCFV